MCSLNNTDSMNCGLHHPELRDLYLELGKPDAGKPPVRFDEGREADGQPSLPAYSTCAREAHINAGASPAGAIRRFSTADRANCVAARRGGEQAWSRTDRSQ
jgi:hypothetical protein